MRTLICFVIFWCGTLGNQVNPQNASLSGIDVFTLDGSRINAAQLAETGEPVIILFWKWGDPKSLDQLSTLNEACNDGIIDRDVKVIGICTDINGADQMVKPFINGNEIICIDIYCDRNNDLSRTMGISDLPQIFLFEKFPRQYTSYIGYYPEMSELITGWMAKNFARKN